jgi:rhodanese-related sulfurtransferase
MSDRKSRDIDISKLKEYQKDSEVVIVDVREKSEIAETGVLPGGINIPLGELEEALNKSPDDFKKSFNRDKPSKDTKMVFSCRSGKRSLNALNKALSLGYSESENFAGGWLEWEKNSKQ